MSHLVVYTSHEMLYSKSQFFLFTSPIFPSQFPDQIPQIIPHFLHQFLVPIPLYYIEIDFHFVRDMVAAKQLNVRFISSVDQLADVLTKPISSSRFAPLRTKLNVLSIPLGLRGRVKDNHQLLQSLSIQDKHQTTQQLKDFSNPTTQDNNKS